jgi:hypothetical protein
MTILFTSALIDFFFDQRKNEYTQSFEVLKSFGLEENIHIIECTAKFDTFLDKLTSKVFYTNQNYKYKNKGVNEILNIKFFLDNHLIDDEETIIKLTGRYILQDNSFIEACKEKYDVTVKFDIHRQAFFGCLGLKKKVLTDFINSTDWLEVENNFICIEKSFAEFLINRNYDILEIGKINIKCNINNNDLHYL